MNHSWQKFWDSYRNRDAATEEDLFVQVGKTVNRKPISGAALRWSVERIAAQLQLTPETHLMDLCCGNGLISFEVAKYVARVTAVDFASHLIDAARQFKARPNIVYHVGNAIDLPPALASSGGDLPDKYLMSDSLAYFEPVDLGRILDNILLRPKLSPFLFLLTGIPNFELKWNFYNTAERRNRHLENERRPDNTNDGLGRWWHAAEIEALCRSRGLAAKFANQPADISNYRMDALIGRAD